MFNTSPIKCSRRWMIAVGGKSSRVRSSLMEAWLLLKHCHQSNVFFLSASWWWITVIEIFHSHENPQVIGVLLLEISSSNCSCCMHYTCFLPFRFIVSRLTYDFCVSLLLHNIACNTATVAFLLGLKELSSKNCHARKTLPLFLLSMQCSTPTQALILRHVLPGTGSSHCCFKSAGSTSRDVL